MSKFWSEIVKGIEPYVPGEQPKDKKYIKLNTNENPYPPSPKVIDIISQRANDDLRLYPDPTCSELIKVLKDYHNLSEKNVFVGNGSDELLAFCFLAFFNPGDVILFPDITYSFYEVYAALFRIDYIKIALDEEFNIPVEEFYRENKGVLIANPNAPTGKILPIDKIKSILDNNKDRVVVVDEAYIDFGGESAVKLINDYENLLVVQTLSKSRSLAGMRIGFALGNEVLIEGLNRVKNSVNSYTLDRLAIACGAEAFKDEEYFRETTSKIIKIRESISTRLTDLGFKVVPSMANFIFISHPKFNAKDLFNNLKENGVLVRHFNKPRIDNYLRVSIGSDEEMDFFYNVVCKVLNN